MTFAEFRSDIAIRLLTAADAALWQSLRLEALEREPTAFATSLEEGRAQDAAARIPAADDASLLIGAFDGARLIGSAGMFVHARPRWRHKGMLWGVYVQAAYRRRGIADDLVRTAVTLARDRVAVLQLFVGMHNTGARALYRRHGFAPYGIERRALRIDGADYDDELMVIDFCDDGVK